MVRFKVIGTHNPQDFFNGIEPPELSRIYETENLEESVMEELEKGYQVIVKKAGGIDGRNNDIHQDRPEH